MKLSRIRKRTATAVAVALALPLVAMAPGAQAAFITEFSYDVDSAFSDWAQINPLGNSSEDGTGVVGSQGNADLSGQATLLSWGAAGGTLSTDGPGNAENSRSALEVTPEVTGTVKTNGPAVPGATVQVINNAILDGATYLDAATILSRVSLTAIEPPGATGDDIRSFEFRVNFTETQNDAPCPGDSSSTCDDILVLSADTPLSYTFTEDDVMYTVSLDIQGLSPLLPGACEAAGAEAECLGVLTEEEAISDVETSFTITADRVVEAPAPSTLSILALGLLCLITAGFTRRRRAD